MLSTENLCVENVEDFKTIFRRSVSGDKVERVGDSPTTHTATHTASNSSVHGAHEDLDRITLADLPEPTSRVDENKTDTDTRYDLLPGLHI